MSIGTIIVGGLVVFACTMALAMVSKDKEGGGCCGCHGNCASCHSAVDAKKPQEKL